MWWWSNGHFALPIYGLALSSYGPVGIGGALSRGACLRYEQYDMLWSKYSQKCCNLFDDVKRIVKKKVAKIIIKIIVDVVSQIFLFIVQPMIESSERPAVRYARLWTNGNNSHIKLFYIK